MRKVWLLVKFFREEQHADQFIEGKIYMNRLSFFKKIENEPDDGRADENEAIFALYQPNGIHISVNVPGIGSTELTSQDLASPSLSFSSNQHDFLHVFCIYAIYTEGFDSLDNGIILSTREEVGRLRSQLEIDERNFDFGTFAVITPAKQFLSKLRSSLLYQKYKFDMKLVDYYDEKQFHGKFNEIEIPFKKQLKFSYQNEYRICVCPKTFDSNPLIIDIGSIRDISTKTISSSLK